LVDADDDLGLICVEELLGSRGELLEALDPVRERLQNPSGP